MASLLSTRLLFVLLCILLTSFTSCQYDHVVLEMNTTKEHALKESRENYFKMTVKEEDIKYFGYIRVSTSPKDFLNPAHIYIGTSNNEFPINKNAEIYSTREGENEVWVDTDLLKRNPNLYIGVVCEQACNFNITTMVSKQLVLMNEFDELTYVPKDESSFVYFYPTNSTTDLFVYVIGSQDNHFDVTVRVRNISDNVILDAVDVRKNFYEGYGAIVSLNSENADLTMIEIGVVIDLPNDSQELTVGVVLEDNVISVHKMQRMHGIVDNIFITKQCYDLADKNPGVDALFYIESYTQGVQFYVIDGADSWNVVYNETLNYNNWTVVPANLLTESLICFERPVREVEDVQTAYTFQYTYLDNDTMFASQPYVSPLSSGVFYEMFLPSGGVTYYRRKTIDEGIEQTFANMIPLTGNPLIFPYVCSDFPYCRITDEEMQRIKEYDLGENKFELKNQTKLVQDTSSLSAYQDEKIVYVVYCFQEKGNCTFLIEVDNGGAVELLPNVEYLAMNERDSAFYFRPDMNYGANNLKFTTFSFVGSASPLMDGMAYTLQSAGNKQVYTFKYSTEKKFEMKSDDYNAIYTAMFTTGQQENLLQTGFVYTEFVTLGSNGTKYIFDLKSFKNTTDVNNTHVILTVRGLNCLPTVKIDGQDYFIADNKFLSHNIEDTTKTTLEVELGVKSFDSKTNNTNEICVIHLGAVENGNKKGLTVIEGEVQAMKLTMNDPIRYFSLPLYFGQTMWRYPYHFFEVFVETETNVKVTIATGAWDNVVKEVNIYRNDIILFGSTLYEHCTLQGDSCIMLIKFEKDSSINSVTMSFVFTSKNDRPMYIEKNKMYSQYFPNKYQPRYYYTDVNQNEEGEILFTYPKQPTVYASLFKKDKIYEFDWLGRIPLSFYFTEQLVFDSYTKSFQYTANDTAKCVNGCELHIMYEQDKYVEARTTIINQYSFHISVKNELRLKTTLLPDEWIQRTFVDMEEKYFYKLTIPYETDRILILLDTTYGQLRINFGEKDPTETETHWHMTPKDRMLVIYQSDPHVQTQLKGSTFTLFASLQDLVEGETSLRFKVMPQYANNRNFEIIKTTYSQHEVCEVKDVNGGDCYFMVYLPNDILINRFYTYAESRISPSIHLTTRANIRTKKKIDPEIYGKRSSIETFFPTKDLFDITNYDNENYLLVMSANDATTDVYILMSVHSDIPTVIDFYTSNLDTLRDFELSSNEKQLMFIHENTQTLWEINPLFSVNTSSILLDVTVLHGTGLVSIVNTVGGNFMVHPNFSFQRGFDVFTGGDFVNSINAYFGGSMLVLGSFIYYVKNKHIERLSMDYVNEYELSKENYPMQFYTALTNETSIDILLKFHNRLSYEITTSNFPFTLRTYQITEDFLKERRRDSDLPLEPEFPELKNHIYVDTFDLSLIHYDLNRTNPNLNYLFIILETQQNVQNELYNNSNILISLTSKEQNRLITIPRGKYYYDTFDANIVNATKRYILNTGDLPDHNTIQVEFDESLHNEEYPFFDVTLLPSELNPYCSRDGSPDLIMSEIKMNGKTVRAYNYGASDCSEYILTVTKKADIQPREENEKKFEPIGFVIKYTTSANVTEHNYYTRGFTTYAPKYRIDYPFKFTESNNGVNNSKTIEFVTIRHNHDDKVYTPFYYLRIYNQTEINREGLSSIKTLFPFDLVDYKVLPVFEKLYKEKDQNKTVTDTFVLPGELSEYAVSLLVSIRVDKDEQSIGIYSDSRDDQKTQTIIFIIVAAILICAVLLIGGFFVFRHLMQLGDNEEKINKAIGDVGAIMDGNTNSIVNERVNDNEQKDNIISSQPIEDKLIDE